jgi:hypothetical protein
MAAQYETIIAPTTTGIATKTPFETGDSPSVTVSADGLGGAETCTLFIDSNGTGTYKALSFSDSTAVTLTVARPAVTLQGGPRYAVTKDATSANCGVYVCLSTPNR